MIEMLAVIAACAVYSLFSKRLARTVLYHADPFHLPWALALSVPLKATLPPDAVHEGKIVLAEVTLILVLFADASHVRFRRLRMDWALPARMLVIGMPLTIGFGTALVYGLNPGSDLAMALLTAAVLTPTDAALGQAVVANPVVPGHLGQTINVESGLNDGLALPFVLLGATLASIDHRARTGFGAASCRRSPDRTGLRCDGRSCGRLGNGKGDGLGTDP